MMKKKSPLEKLREKEKKARRKIIVDAAERVFATKPFSKVSMRDISKESEISLSSIYRYFPNQQDLFLEALSRGTKKINKTITPLLKKDNVTVAIITDTFLNFLIENDLYFRMMSHFMLDGVLNKESIEKMNGMERSLIDQFDTLFKKINPDADVRFISHSFFACLNGILITFRNYPGRDIDDVHKHMKLIGCNISLMFSEFIKQK